MSKKRRLAILFICFLVLILVLGVAGVAWLFYRAMPSYAGEARLSGLAAPVRIVRDPHGVPHIFADTANDAARALGYVHASERLFQMEMQRRAGQGRLAEAVGPSLLEVDRFIRTLGLYGLAESSFAAMSPDAQGFFQAYSDGVNDWLKAHRGTLPPEFMLLSITPEKWRPADSIVWGKLMALQLSSNEKLERLRAELAVTLSPQQVRELFPPPPDGSPVTLRPSLTQKAGSRDDRGFAGLEAAPPMAVAAEDRRDGKNPAGNSVFDKLGALTSLDHAASNEWVIAGERTASGKPILANDPHLDLAAPILWYLARIVTPDLSVKGATVPGLPVVLLGQNDHIAWGFTTTGSDVQDLFIETLDPQNPERYLTPQGTAPFLTRREVIHVKGAADVILKIRATRHGPVLSDIDPDLARIAGAGKVVALAFTGLGDKDRTSEALMRLNRAVDWDAFLAALRLYQAPPQNIVYADTGGTIGFISPGLVPVRKSGYGLVPADGASGHFDWIGFVPFSEWPKLHNPKAGFVFNANNALFEPGQPYYYGVDWEEPYRAERLQQFFDTLPQHTLASSAAMQADHLSLAAKALLPYLLRARSNDPRVAEALELMKNWDGVMDRTRPEPLIFTAWLRQMRAAMLVAKTGPSWDARGPLNASIIAGLLERDAASWCGEADCRTLITAAMLKALDQLGNRDGTAMKNWRWGDEHRTLLQHKVFGQVPILKDLTDLSVGSSGDFYTLDRGGSFSPTDEHPFARTHGGGFRGLYDLADPAQSRFMIATGESGHVLSRHYGDFVPLWNEVQSITLSGSEAELTAAGLPELILKPE